MKKVPSNLIVDDLWWPYFWPERKQVLKYFRNIFRRGFEHCPRFFATTLGAELEGVARDYSKQLVENIKPQQGLG